MKTKHIFIAIFLSYFFVLFYFPLSYAVQKENVIGKWSDTAYKNTQIYIFVEDKNDIVMYSIINNKDIKKMDTLKKKNNKYFSQLHQHWGEYYIINNKNELEIYDEEGFIRKCLPYSGMDLLF